PSVACILVSRSDIYQRWFGDTVPSDNPGKLGAFDPADPNLKLNVPERDRSQLEEYRKALAKKNSRPREVGSDYEVKRLFDLSDPEYVPESYGSGVVIDAKGLVLTHYHVVRDAAKVYL